MPLNRGTGRLKFRRPSSSSSFSPSSSQSLAWFNRIGTGPLYGLSATERNAYDTMITGLVSDGVWSLLDALYIFATNNATNANYNLISTSYGITPVNSPSFAPDVGYTGNGSSSYLNTGYLSSTGPQWGANSCHLSVFAQNNVAQGTEVAIGCDAGTYAYIQPYVSGGNFYYDLNAGSFPNAANPMGGTKGAWVVSRTGGSAEAAYYNGNSTAFISSAVGSSAPPAQAIYIGALNNAGTASNWSTLQISAASMGAALTNTQSVNLMSRVNTYLNALGVKVY